MIVLMPAVSDVPDRPGEHGGCAFVNLCYLNLSNFQEFRKRFERSEAIERLERLERTDPMLNGAQRLNGLNVLNWPPH